MKIAKRVLVYGMGTSGQAVCKLLHGQGACVSFYDDENRFGNFFNFDKEPTKHDYDMVVVSPGVKVIGNSIISHFVINKTPIFSELDIGYMFSKGKFIGITGTNGKTTTTMLVGKIFKEAGKEVIVCGNIGLPIASVCQEGDKKTYFITEVSNFQLELSRVFYCSTACILNIEPDHLDRHGSMQEYVRVKRKILSKKKTQKVILNFDDEYSKLSKFSKNNLYFSKKLLNKGVFVKNNWIYYNKIRIISLNDIPLLGEKNLENVLASVAISVANKIKPKFIKSAIMSFKPPAHRLEYLGKLNGALVYDDSKATNVPSVECALKALQGSNILLLMGGRNKDLSFDEFFKKGFSLTQVLCFGEAGDEIYQSAVKFGYNALLFQKMKDACEYVKECAVANMTILLSPACASFDEFDSYAVRGERFKEYLFGEDKKS